MWLFGKQERRWGNKIKAGFVAFIASLGTLYGCECIYINP